jgi:Protein of unknown function (DUF3833)
MKKLLCPLLAALVLSACVKPLPEEKWAAAGPEMRPEKFFAGIAHGNGVIQTPSGTPARRIMVESKGAALQDGRFRLDQTITDDRGKVSTRFWMMQQTGPTTYTSSLSDAAGEVKGEVKGNLFHLKYLLKKPFVTMEQWLWLQPDGRTVMNEGRISMPGRTIARLSEIIVREEQKSAEQP